jgi:hypothetical protein
MAHARWQHKLRTLACLALAATALANGGCLVAAAGAAAGAGVAGYAYCKGKVYQEYNAGFEDTLAAIHTSLVELGLAIESEQRDGATALIEGHTGTGDRFRLDLDVVTSPIPVEGPLTRVSVRIGIFGDPPLSDRILSQIGTHLVAGPRPPPVPQLGPIQPAWSRTPQGPTPAPAVTPAGFAPQSPEPPLLKPSPSG